MYVKCLEKKCQEIMESKLENGQCGFRPRRNNTDQIFTLRQIFEKSWEYAKDVFACFIDLEKAYDRVPRVNLWRVLQEYGSDGHRLMVIYSLVGVGFRQGCVLSPLFFIIYMNWMDKLSRINECVTIGICKISRLLFCR